MNRLLAVLGPTAVGKTSLGIVLAKQYRGELVSADSRQIYRGMDIGTGKDLPRNVKVKAKSEKLQVKVKNFKTLKPYRFNSIPVWLLDIAKPDYRFSVADYLKCAQTVIENIWERNKLPVVVGGTGFYIKTLLEGVESIGVKPDWKLREKLQRCKVVKLQNILKETCPEHWQRMNESDRQNPRRLIRAIEVSASQKLLKSPKSLKIDSCLLIGLKASYSDLYHRIDERVEKRVEQGIEREIQSLLKQGYRWDNSALGSTLGYREWEPLLKTPNFTPGVKNQTTPGVNDIVQKWKYDEHAYARRQMTWFKRQKNIKWLDVTQKKFQKDIDGLVSQWYNV